MERPQSTATAGAGIEFRREEHAATQTSDAGIGTDTERRSKREEHAAGERSDLREGFAGEGFYQLLFCGRR